MTANEIANKNADINRDNAETNRKNAETNRMDARTRSRAEDRQQEMKGWQKADTILSGVGSVLNPFRNLLKRNDPWWYNANPAATKAVANISYRVPLGTSSRAAANRVLYPWDETTVDIAIPGIATFGFVPTFTDPSTLRTAISRVYANVRYHNSGSRNYDAVDYGLYLLMADSIIMNFVYAEKIFKCLNTFSNENKYVAYNLLTSLGLSGAEIEQMQRTITDDIARFNLLVTKFNSLSVPSVFTLMQRHAWMAGVVLRDSHSERAQLYQYKPEIYYVYTSGSTTSMQAGAMQPKLLSAFKVLDAIEEQLNALLTIEDYGIMSGDSIKAYGYEGMFHLSTMDVANIGIIEPIYSAEELAQLNAATVNGPIVYESFGIYQKEGSLYQGHISGQNPMNPRIIRMNTEFAAASGNGATKLGLIKDSIESRVHVCNAYTNMTPELNMVQTRLMNDRKYDEGADTTKLVFSIENAGSEILTTCKLVVRGHGPNVNVSYDADSFFEIEVWDGAILTDREELAISAIVATFDWMPYMAIYQGTATDYPNGTLTEIRGASNLFDYADYAEISSSLLLNMHQVALISLLNIGTAPSSTVSMSNGRSKRKRTK